MICGEDDEGSCNPEAKWKTRMRSEARLETVLERQLEVWKTRKTTKMGPDSKYVEGMSDEDDDGFERRRKPRTKKGEKQIKHEYVE
jgi:hypothetical protein